MKTTKQPKYLGPRGNDEQAILTVLGAIEECRAKPHCDYQRIIVCYTRMPDFGPRLARRAGAELAGRDWPGGSKRGVAVLAIEKAEHRGEETLESIVSFVNRTRGVVVLLASERTLAGWHLRWRSAAARIRRRTHLMFDFD